MDVVRSAKHYLEESGFIAPCDKPVEKSGSPYLIPRFDDEIAPLAVSFEVTIELVKNLFKVQFSLFFVFPLV